MYAGHKFRSRFHCLGIAGNPTIDVQIPFKEKGQVCYQKGTGPVICVPGGVRGELKTIPGLPLPGGQCVSRRYIMQLQVTTQRWAVSVQSGYRYRKIGGPVVQPVLNWGWLRGKIGVPYLYQSGHPQYREEIRVMQNIGFNPSEAVLGVGDSISEVLSVKYIAIIPETGSQQQDVAQCGSNLEKCNIKIYGANDEILSDIDVNGSCFDVQLTSEPGKCTFYSDKSRITKRRLEGYVKNENAFYDILDYTNENEQKCVRVFFYTRSFGQKGATTNIDSAPRGIVDICSPKGCNLAPFVQINCDGGGSKPPYQPPGKPKEKCPPGTYCEEVENGTTYCCDECGNLLKSFRNE